MSNEFFNQTGNPQPNSPGASNQVRSEFLLVQNAFDKLPSMTGNGGKVVIVNPFGTGMTTTMTLSGFSIVGGTVNGAVIGALTPAAAAFTSASASAGFSGNLTGNVAGDVVGNVTSSGSSTFENVTINGTLNMNLGTTGTITGLTSPTGATDAATKGYVDSSIASLVASAPGTLDTLNELAAALGNDPNYATSTANLIATKLSLTGGALTGVLSMGGNKITNLATPTASPDAVNLGYVTTLFGSTASAAASATSAATSASQAQGFATSASNSATAAQAAQAAAEAVYDNFDDRYLGPKSSNPTVDNDGNALLTGALYFNTSATPPEMRVYTGTAWVTAYNAGIAPNTFGVVSGNTGTANADQSGDTLAITGANGLSTTATDTPDGLVIEPTYGSPAALGPSASAGTQNTFARSDHVHQYPTPEQIGAATSSQSIVYSLIFGA
jgi:hypothetical protein